MAGNLGTINAIIGADTSKLQAGLNDAKTKLSSFASGANQASLAMVNLGRVAQDAPFGFIAISNNLNPLLESLQRLKQETGTTGGALKALVTRLTGADGLGLALSLVTSTLSFAQMGFASWTRGFSSAGKEIDELTKKMDGFREDVAKELVSFRELTTVAADANAPIHERKKAVEELRKEYGPFLRNLSDEQILTNQLGDAYDKINKALLAKLTVQAAEEKIIPILKQQIEIQQKNADLQKDIAAAAGLSQKEIDAANKAGIQSVGIAAARAAGSKKELETNQKAITELQKQIDKLFDSIKGSLSLEKLIDIDKDDPVKKVKTKVKEIAEVLQRNHEWSPKLGVIIDFELPPPTKLNEGIQRAGERIKETTQKLFQNGEENIWKKLIKDSQKVMQVYEGIADSLANIFGSIFKDGKVSLDGIGQALMNLIAQLAQAAIRAAILAALLSAVGFGVGPSGSLVKGLNGSFGSIFGNLLGGGAGLFGHAEGGIFSGPTMFGNHVFGEAGPEALIPLDRLNSMLGGIGRGQNIMVTGRVELGYNTLAVAIERKDRYRNRNYGSGL